MSNKLKYVSVFGKSGKRHVCILDKIFRSVWFVQGLKLTWLHEIGFCIKKKMSHKLKYLVLKKFCIFHTDQHWIIMK